jgi:nitrate/nitrite transporter NarK
MKLLRSVASVLLSYVVVYGIVFCSDPLLTHLFPTQYARGQVPPPFLLWISTAIFALASILGGWMCVRIAPFRPAGHLFVLFLLGELVGVYFSWQMWGQGWPHWYSLVWLIVWPVCLWLGGLGKRAAPVPRFAT